MDSDNVVVLGAGLAGSSAALELAERGVQVTLIDQDRVPMNRASLRNEGKIHIGLCYAADSSLKTATMQMDGALKFQSLLRRWIGERADTISLSTPFVYSVAHDSILNADTLEERYSAIEAEIMKRTGLDPPKTFSTAAVTANLFQAERSEVTHFANSARVIQ